MTASDDDTAIKALINIAYIISICLEFMHPKTHKYLLDDRWSKAVDGKPLPELFEAAHITNTGSILTINRGKFTLIGAGNWSGKPAINRQVSSGFHYMGGFSWEKCVIGDRLIKINKTNNSFLTNNNEKPNLEDYLCALLLDKINYDDENSDAYSRKEKQH